MSDSEKHNDERSSYQFRTTTIKSTITKVACHNTDGQKAGPSDEPETSSQLPLSTLQIKPSVEIGFKHYGPRVRLYCKTGHCLTILSDGNVTGDRHGVHKSGILEFSSAGLGEVRIRSVEANLYLAMNQNGNLYGEENPRNYNTVFIEGIYGQYNTYLSQKYAHLGWYVGIKKNGTIKQGSQTRWGQKAIQFLVIRI